MDDLITVFHMRLTVSVSDTRDHFLEQHSQAVRKRILDTPKRKVGIVLSSHEM